jgi:hypothetical protein
MDGGKQKEHTKECRVRMTGKEQNDNDGAKN